MNIWCHLVARLDRVVGRGYRMGRPNHNDASPAYDTDTDRDGGRNGDIGTITVLSTHQEDSSCRRETTL
jgi:hypothetical protein